MATTVDEIPPTSPSFEEEQKRREENLKSGHWDEDALVHHDDPNAPSPAATHEAPPSPTRRVLQGVRSLSILALGRELHKELAHPSDWGRPGELTPEEVKVFVSLFSRKRIG